MPKQTKSCVEVHDNVIIAYSIDKFSLCPFCLIHYKDLFIYLDENKKMVKNKIIQFSIDSH